MSANTEEREVMRLSRRQIIGRGAGLAVGGGDDGGGGNSGATSTTGGAASGEGGGEPIVGDVLDFALRSDEWKGAFGFVSMRLHRGLAGGREVWFIRTDASNEQFAGRERLVYTPKLEPLAEDALSGDSSSWKTGRPSCRPPRATTATPPRGACAESPGGASHASSTRSRRCVPRSVAVT